VHPAPFQTRFDNQFVRTLHDPTANRIARRLKERIGDLCPSALQVAQYSALVSFLTNRSNVPDKCRIRDSPRSVAREAQRS
jgi:hypothetical protein